MVTSQKISVSLIGIENKDHHFIKVVFKLSESRDREYQIIKDRGSVRDNYVSSDIIIVDNDSAESVKQWQQLIELSGVKHTNSTVFITKNKSSTAQKNTVQKPLIALRILNILDQIEVLKKDEAAPVLSENKISHVKIPPSISGNHKVLVIDDSLSVRKHIGNELNKYQCSVDFAANAEEGYWLIQKNKYSLVFLDVILPGMNGHELCKDIKGNTFLRDTPIVMLTSKSSPFDRVKGRLSGCNDYLTKPVKAGKLHQIIEKYLLNEKAMAN